MVVFFLMIFFICLAVMVTGLFNPARVIFWDTPDKTPSTVLKTYGIAAAAALVIAGLFA